MTGFWPWPSCTTAAGRRPENQQPGCWFPTLDELGITRNQAMRARRVAALDEAELERRIAAWREQEARRRGRAVGSLLWQVARPPAPKHTPPLPWGCRRR